MKFKNGCGKIETELQYSTKTRPVRDQIYSYFVKYLENGVTYKTSLYRPVRSSDISTFSNQQFGWKYFSESQLLNTYFGQKWCKPKVRASFKDVCHSCPYSHIAISMSYLGQPHNCHKPLNPKVCKCSSCGQANFSSMESGLYIDGIELSLPLEPDLKIKAIPSELSRIGCQH